MELEFNCLVCGQESRLSDVEPPTMELMLGVLSDRHSHSRAQVKAYYESELERARVYRGIEESEEEDDK